MQCSLIISDLEVYEGLVRPYKESRELNKLLVRCLKAYYRSDDVRKLVEGIDSDEEPSEASSGVQTSTDICNNIRNMLSMQSFLTEELETAIDEGKEDIEVGLRNINKMAVDRGVAKPKESNKGMLKLDDKFAQAVSSGSIGSGTQSTDTEKFIMQMLMRMCSNSGDIEGANIIKQRLDSEGTDNSQGVQETPMQTEPSQVPITPQTQNEFSNQGSAVDTSSFNEFATQPMQHEEKEPEHEITAKESMQDLVESLGGF